MRIHQVVSEDEQRPVRLSCASSCRRRAHLKCLVLTLLIIACLIAIVWCRLPIDNRTLQHQYQTWNRTTSVGICVRSGYIYIPIGLLLILYVIYLGECWHCQSRIDIRTAVDASAVYQQVRALRQASPVIWWKADCYHLERRVRQVTIHRRRRDFLTSHNSQILLDRVSTQVTTTAFDYTRLGVRDRTKRLVHLEKHPAVRIRFLKKFSFASSETERNFIDQRLSFIQENQVLDDRMDFSEGMDLLNINFPDQIFALGNATRRPWFLTAGIFWSFSAVLLSWPLRLYIDSQTAHVLVEVRKEFGQSNNPLSMGNGSENLGSRQYGTFPLGQNGDTNLFNTIQNSSLVAELGGANGDTKRVISSLNGSVLFKPAKTTNDENQDACVLFYNSVRRQNSNSPKSQNGDSTRNAAVLHVNSNVTNIRPAKNGNLSTSKSRFYGKGNRRETENIPLRECGSLKYTSADSLGKRKVKNGGGSLKVNMINFAQENSNIPEGSHSVIWKNIPYTGEGNRNPSQSITENSKINKTISNYSNSSSNFQSVANNFPPSVILEMNRLVNKSPGHSGKFDPTRQNTLSPLSITPFSMQPINEEPPFIQAPLVSPVSSEESDLFDASTFDEPPSYEDALTMRLCETPSSLHLAEENPADILGLYSANNDTETDLETQSISVMTSHSDAINGSPLHSNMAQRTSSSAYEFNSVSRDPRLGSRRNNGQTVVIRMMETSL